MTPQERLLWAASHNLPEGILLIYETEMRQIQAATLGTIAEIRKWKATGRSLLGVETPEQAFDVIRLKLDRLDELEKENAAFKEKIAKFIDRETPAS